jgi:hypothetical protein
MLGLSMRDKNQLPLFTTKSRPDTAHSWLRHSLCIPLRRNGTVPCHGRKQVLLVMHLWMGNSNSWQKAMMRPGQYKVMNSAVGSFFGPSSLLPGCLNDKYQNVMRRFLVGPDAQAPPWNLLPCISPSRKTFIIP